MIKICMRSGLICAVYVFLIFFFFEYFIQLQRFAIVPSYAFSTRYTIGYIYLIITRLRNMISWTYFISITTLRYNGVLKARG